MADLVKVMGDNLPTSPCSKLQTTPCPSEDHPKTEGTETPRSREWPRNPLYDHYYAIHDEERKRRSRFGIALKAPFVSLGTGRYLGFGGDVSFPVWWTKSYNIGLGYIYYPFKELGDSGQRMSIFLDYPHISCSAKFRLGVFSEMPKFGEIGNKGREKMVIGAMGETLLTFLKAGPFRLGASIIAGAALDLNGNIRLLASGGGALEIEF